MTKLRLRSRVNFPATVTGEGGFTVRKENGHWIVAPDFSDLSEITAPQLTDPTTQQVWVYNPTANSYAVLTLAGLGDALYVATSTTSLAIGTGSKAFTIQTGKDFGDGSYVIATSDANPDTDFMFGQITDYTGATLTVNVIAIGGSGTHTDWTIRLAGARGAVGATGASPGIKQAYSDTTADADPGDGVFRLNNATPASATAAYLDNIDASGATVSGVFDTWDDSTNTVKGTIRFEKDGDASVWASHQVTGSVVDGTGYRKLTLANGAGSGAFTAADTFAITFLRAGDKGADGSNGTVAVSGTPTVGQFGIWTNSTTVKGVSVTGIVKGNGSSDPTAASDGTDYLSSATGMKQGKQTIWIPAAAMISRTTNGAATGSMETTTNKNMFRTLDFDASTQEFAQFEVFFPKSWNLGTVTFRPVWSHASTTTNFGVVWSLAGVARSDDDAGDVAFGGDPTSSDTGGTTNDIYIGPESSAVTIAGTPAAGDVVQFQVSRIVSDGGDTMAIDARLHGIQVFFTTNAANDA
jgi:hypothetical protein